MRFPCLLRAAAAAGLASSMLVAAPVLAAPSTPPHPVSPTVTTITVPATAAGRSSAAGSGATAHALAAGPDATGPVRADRLSAGTVLADTGARSTAPFELVGASWGAASLPAGTTVAVRTRSDDHWSAWSVLEATDAGPDSGSVDATAAAGHASDADRSADHDVVSEPVWAGRSDGAQLRVVAAGGASSGGVLVDDVRLTLIDPGTSAADASAGGQGPAGQASASEGRPTIYTRAQWGADESLRDASSSCRTSHYGSTITMGFVHHADSSNDYTEADVPGIIRAIYAYHVRSNGWCDIGYNFVVDKFGQIWEGYRGGVDRPVLGSHTGGFNTNSFGAVVLGTYTSTPLTPPTLDALSHLFAWKLTSNYRDPTGTVAMTSSGGGTSRYAKGVVHRFSVISGHRDAGNTACPGNAAYAQLPQLRSMVAALMPAGFVDPQATTTQAGPTTTPSVRVQAGSLAAGTSWTATVADSSDTVVATRTGIGSVDATVPLLAGAGDRLPAGDYRVTLTGSDGELPWSDALTLGRAPIGSLDAVAATTIGASTSTATARGWVLDPDTDAPTGLALTVDGTRQASATATGSRPDVGGAYPGYGDNHGFSAAMSATNGSHRVCLQGRDDQRGDYRDITCRAVTFGPTLAPPVGTVDGLVRRPGGLQVSGWSYDPNDDPSAVSITISADGKPLGTVAPAQPRPDVAAARRGAPTTSGWSSYVSLTPGTRTVCATARLASGGSAALGCVPSRILPGGTATGIPDSITTAGSSVRLQGWTLDPDTAESTHVHVYVDGQGALNAVADGNRPDIARVYPGYGAAHGFDVTITAGPGRHQVCVFSINQAGGGSNSLMLCRDVTVRGSQPIGALDGVSRVDAGRVLVRGWAIDPDTTASVPVSVAVGGTTTSVPATGSRPDVGRAYPGYGSAHGFSTVVSAAAGSNVCVSVPNAAGPGSSAVLGCARP